MPEALTEPYSVPAGIHRGAACPASEVDLAGEIAALEREMEACEAQGRPPAELVELHEQTIARLRRLASIRRHLEA